MTKLMSYLGFLFITLISLNQYAYANMATVIGLQEDAWIYRD